ncbi:crosslink repair DNA glycosylase YcaQ family protein [Kineosporia sp. NBRC 101731]|uniref:DNA glycosylase AlkZ-like family protein n=1 Tax=Kineosporia sp. NBRC 101731 TaxID=3032199 RepID=UPI0024A59753|nr:crosslink repair DNA glycosylase YcaQ family protein [Kineosporia sp. NBRC 101731]GLY31872.1 hypothetical protein Kisp02_52370 [Kineosporia sp. NBRC 101731]
MNLTRENVLGYRFRAQGLDRDGGVEGLLGLGIQDTPAGTAATALAARGAERPPGTRIVWSWRGAPHVHAEADLKRLAAATWPVDDADATRRISNPRIKEGARRGLEAFVAAATALREAVTEKLPKGEVSRRVSATVPDDLNFDCPTCESRHISGGLFQLVGVAAGVEVVTQGRSTFLQPLPAALRRREIPRAGSGLDEMLLRYLHVNGPVSSAALAAHAGMTATALKPHLPAGLVEVSAGNTGKVWAPEGDLEDLRRDARPEAVRLLPGGDPWLTVRDRDLVVPGAEQHRAIYTSLSNPGVVLVNGDVTGTWRAKRAGRVLDLEITAFGDLSAAVKQQVEQEARLIAPARAAQDARVRYA